MDRKLIREMWHKHALTCRKSYTHTFIKSICKDFNIKFNKNWIYTKPRYREDMTFIKERIDAEEFLKVICKKHKILPFKDHLLIADKMFGEGSRRACVEEAYLGDLR